MPVSEMRILVLFGSVVIFGSERGNLEVLDALREQGARVLLVMSDADYAAGAHEYVASRGFEFCTAPYFVPPRDDYRINPWINLPLNMIRGSHRFFKIHKAFRPTHIHTGAQLNVLNFLPALAVVRTPLVYRCGDVPVLHNRVWKIVWRFIARRAARFGVVSEYIAKLMVTSGVPSDKLTVVYSRPPTRKPVEDQSPPSGGSDIAYVGRVSEEKGVGLLVEAFERLAGDFPHTRLMIAGPVTEWAGDSWGRSLQRRVRADAVLRDRVHFLGYLEDVPGLLSRCSFLVAPTLIEEAMGNVVMEAKLAGLPSIIFRSGGFPEVIRHGTDGYICEEKTPEALEVGMRAYLEDPEATRRQGEKAKLSLKVLGVEEFSERWGRIYQEAAR